MPCERLSPNCRCTMSLVRHPVRCTAQGVFLEVSLVAVSGGQGGSTLPSKFGERSVVTSGLGSSVVVSASKHGKNSQNITWGF